MSMNSYGDVSPPSHNSPPLPVILIVIFLVFFFFGFFTLYFCRCVLENLVSMWNHGRNPPGAVAATADATASNGLDPDLIQAFPTFYYSTVKEFRREKYGLECAICLGEFSEDDMLRLLTICCHVFHKECVDLWLESHKTCPVCRGELDVPRKSLEKSPILVHSNSMHEIGADHQSSVQDAVCIDIKEGGEEEDDEAQASADTIEQDRREHDQIQRFSRSHSTGHSISRTSEEGDKFTLRLLDHVKLKIVRGHNSARSCITFDDFTCPSGYRDEGCAESSETRQGDIDRA